MVMVGGGVVLGAGEQAVAQAELAAQLLAVARVNLSLTHSIDRCMFSFLIFQGSCACTRARAPGCGRRARQGAS
jgi:hypothetical protein